MMGVLIIFSANKTTILDRLNISEESWLTLTLHFEEVFKGAVGTHDSLTLFAQHKKLKRRQGLSHSLKLLKTA